MTLVTITPDHIERLITAGAGARLYVARSGLAQVVGADEQVPESLLPVATEAELQEDLDAVGRSYTQVALEYTQTARRRFADHSAAFMAPSGPDASHRALVESGDGTTVLVASGTKAHCEDSLSSHLAWNTLGEGQRALVLEVVSAQETPEADQTPREALAALRAEVLSAGVEDDEAFDQAVSTLTTAVEQLEAVRTVVLAGTESDDVLVQLDAIFFAKDA